MALELANFEPKSLRNNSRCLCKVRSTLPHVMAHRELLHAGRSYIACVGLQHVSCKPRLGSIARLERRGNKNSSKVPTLFCVVSPHQANREEHENIEKTMPRFLITTKRMKNDNGVRIEPGMSVEVVTQSMTNPLLNNGGRQVADAFMRIYGIDLKRAGALNTNYLDVERVG